MRKFLGLFSVLLMLMFVSTPVQAKLVGFEEGIAVCDKKPLVVLITADWARTGDQAESQFKLLQKYYGNSLNYSVIDVGDSEAAAYNSKFAFERGIPYVMYFRNGGKISRFLNQECVLRAESCMIPKIKTFY